MNLPALHLNEIDFDLRVILDHRSDFQARYIAVSNLRNAAATSPATISDSCVAVVKDILGTELCSEARQRLCFYREAADFFVLLFLEKKTRSEHALSTLRHFLKNADEEVHRAIAESLGALSIPLPNPEISLASSNPIPEVSFSEILNNAKFPTSATGRIMGRSIVLSHDSLDEVLVLKCAKDADDCNNLLREASWMEHISTSDYQFEAQFHIPQPVKYKNTSLTCISDLPSHLIPKGYHSQETHVVFLYQAHPDYFRYPNGSDSDSPPTMGGLPEIMHQNSYLLGRLMHYGLTHTAPIPMFHNRLQRGRRDDQGLYDWPQAGRLDRWLESAAFPNIGLSGTRDFEHFENLAQSDRSPYWHIGVHILSLLLIVGSCFRNKDKRRVGLDPDGNPVDARSLFDSEALTNIVQAIFAGYYLGFSGTRYDGEIPFDLECLTKRMIEEMGVDNYMEEILRRHDQLQMTDEQFGDFLQTNGHSEKSIRLLRKGAEDLIVHTGPHLGGFNDRISLMELIKTTATISAICILGRFQNKPA